MRKVLVILHKSMLVLILSFLVAVLGATLVGFTGWHGYLADQCSQLRIVYISALVLLALPILVLRSRTAFIMALLTLCLNLIPIVPFYLPSGAEPLSAISDKRNLEIVTINIFGARNHNYNRVVDFVHQKRPDMLCLNEITKQWLEHLNVALPEYKYHFDEGISGGAAIYSRIPIERIVPNSKTRRYGVRGKITLDGTAVIVIAEHPPAPSARERWQGRNGELKRLIVDAHDATDPLILIGDLNSTPWSPYFQELVEKGKFKDSELGKGIQPSWNALMPVPPMVPIDHCLTSDHFSIVERSLGPNVGSDHLPVYVKLRLQEHV